MIVPPRNPTQNSIPSILQTLSSEYDALILELFDTRKALQETKEELTHALYQNDAAVRVIARVVMERDMARKELAQWKVLDRSSEITQVGEVASTTTTATTEGSNKRKRLTDDEPAMVHAEDHEMIENTSNKVQEKGGIPDTIKKELKDRWMVLSSERKAKTKGADGYAAFEDIQSFSAEKKSYHKTAVRGILAMTGGGRGDGQLGRNDKIITSSTDKHLTVFDWEENKVENDFAAKAVAGGAGLLDCVGDTVAMVDSNGGLKVLVGNKFVAISGIDDHIALDHVVGVKVHPTGRHVFVAEKSGRIHFFGLDADSETMTEATSWNGVEDNSDDISCTCIGLHPDGLILAIGRSDGKIGLWDLNTEKLATTLGMPNETESSPITVIDFSEKGVHLASVDAAGNVSVWDLRKQKSMVSMSVPEGVSCVSFCPIGKYFAYGTLKGQVIVTVVKDWDKKTILSDGGNGAISGLLWGKDAKIMAVTSKTSRVVKIWGLKNN